MRRDRARMDDIALKEKTERIRAGARPRVLDLFAGCGGFSLGFHASGCEIAGAVEFDPDAAATHGRNFHSGSDSHNKPRDITSVSPEQLAADLGLGPVRHAFDIIVGGPPCQAFARVGRSKLRSVAEHPQAFRHDTRARLYVDYLKYVDACAPLAVVMENVPDMLNHGGHNVAAEVCEVLSARGYVCRYTLLNASFYGVPQMRERMILIAIRHEIADRIEFPQPTHWVSLPAGYESSRNVALKLLNRSDTRGADRFYVPAPEGTALLPKAVTVQEAIGDLPSIDARRLMATGQLKRGARRFEAGCRYVVGSRPNEFVHRMRSWPGFEGGRDITDHVIRYLPRDYPLFARMEPGDQYPEALRMAERMFGEALAARTADGKRMSEGSPEWEALRRSIVPPYSASKFPNKWRKMEADKPARTLMAHLGKDSYSHIHYDSDQARPISVREAARLQSFPDGFLFCGTMNPAFRQIGNAVPPLLAAAVAQEVVRQLTSGAENMAGTSDLRVA